jgi:hypothetical protein
METRNLTPQYVATPQTLINALALANAPFRNTKWAFKWLADNPTQSAALDETLLQLDDEGKEGFGRAVAYYHNQNDDVLAYAQRTLKRMVARKHEEELRSYIQKHGKKTIILANGLRCVLAAAGNACRWYAEVNYKGRQLRLWLQLDQLVALKEKATKKISTLRRMEPSEIQCRRNGQWTTFSAKNNGLVINAIADKMPLEIAAILK